MIISTFKGKIIVGAISAAIVMLLYMFIWVILPNPTRMVDCKIGIYTFELMRQDCKTDFVEITRIEPLYE